MKVFFILLTALATVFSAEAGAAVKKTDVEKFG